MMHTILSRDFQKFVIQHEQDDPYELALKAKNLDSVFVQLACLQIKSRQKAKNKLPEWSAQADIIFPSSLSLEQCSSQTTAVYKAGIVQQGNKMLDLTGGLGVDTYYLGKKFIEVGYIEQDAVLAEIAAHNLKVLEAKNILVTNTTAGDFLRTAVFQDLIYLDPARRDKHAHRVFRLEDCEPEVVGLLPMLLQKSRQILIKTSPMLDIQLAIKTLEFVKQVHVVSVDNECKEVLYLLGSKKNNDPEINAVNIHKNQSKESLNFKYSVERAGSPEFARPLAFLYEPNASIMKSGGFNVLGAGLQLKKIHPNTHLFTSDVLIKEFPGRIFKVRQLLPYDKRKIMNYIPGKANVSTRNFPDDVKAIRKKTGIKDGGKDYILAFTSIDEEKKVAIVDKIK